MKKCIVVLAAVGVLVLSSVVGVFASELVWQNIGRGNMNVRAVLVSPDNSSIIYIGSGRGILKSEDGGESWRNILSVRGTNKEPNFLLFASGDSNSLYAATGNGLYSSRNQGKGWNRIFKGKNYLENECTALAVLPQAFYLGTKAGLFVSNDQGRSWHKETGKLGSSSILAITYNLKESNSVYVAAVEGAFKTMDNGQSWEKIFLSHRAEDGSEAEEVKEDRDEAERKSDIRYISIDPNNSNYLYLATDKGVYKSQDKGKSWELLPDDGLLEREVKFLLISPGSILYALTKTGIFMQKEGRWQDLSLGLAAQEISSLYLDKQGNLYAACDKGLFKGNIVDSSDTKDSAISLYYKDEPQIKAVQDAAIKYAEVEPEKIARWRKQAAKRALLPRLTVDMDHDNDRTTSSSIWGTYSSNGTPGRYFIGPDDETKYDNKNWGVSLTWELGDLIWSDDQTNIDVRSRLMVELRDDILDEVTKLYFERLRVKMELDTLGIEDRKKRFEKELKLQELTASLDALTGGYFSRQIKEN
ncbi:MAG: hypothetical protein NT066_02295 [Candidatus Omnitrophica bacterium]|nr:hypothetical protein [Candidatus Omnitrophota bacterium]